MNELMDELVRKRINQWSVEEVAHLIRSLPEVDLQIVGFKKPATTLRKEDLNMIAGSFVNHKIAGADLVPCVAKLLAGDVAAKVNALPKQHQLRASWVMFSLLALTLGTPRTISLRLKLTFGKSSTEKLRFPRPGICHTRGLRTKPCAMKKISASISQGSPSLLKPCAPLTHFPLASTLRAT